MAMDVNLKGVSTGTAAFAGSASDQLKVILETDATNHEENIGGVRNFNENDQGLVTNFPTLVSPETDLDFRQRVALDTILEDENFSYAAQNTAKHNYSTTTLVFSWTAGAVSTNTSGATVAGNAAFMRTYKTFPMFGASVLCCDCVLSFNNQPSTGQNVEWGFMLNNASAPYAPTDGVFFRLTAAGLQGVISYNGSETTTGVFAAVNGGGTGTFTYTNNTKYQWIIYATEKLAEFWVSDGLATYLLGIIQTGGNAAGAQSTSLPFAIRHSIGATPSLALVASLGRMMVRTGGSYFTDTMSSTGNRLYGSYEGLSGGTMGSLANYANSANPTAAVPTNTTAALGTGLGGQFWETASLAVNTDGIICSYQNPALAITGANKRLVIKGIWLSSYIQTVIVGGPWNAQYSLAFGHTAVSLATAEAATTKAPRRVPLPAFSQLVTSAQAVSTVVAQAAPYMGFANPIYVNPGEFVALVTKHVGTVGTSGTIAHVVAFDYGWE